jgi:hypothetical protein
MKSVFGFLITLILVISYGNAYGITLTPQQERLKEILRDEGEKEYLKQCNDDMGGNLLSLCEDLTDMFQEIIANESQTNNIPRLSNSTVGYYTYTHKGYSLDYPHDWKIDEDTSSVLFYKGSRGFEVTRWDYPGVSLMDSNDIGEISQEAATDDKSEKLLESLQSYDGGLDGEEAVTFLSSDSGILKKVVSVIHDGRAFEFTYSSTEANFDNDDEVMNHFFDTINFE